MRSIPWRDSSMLYSPRTRLTRTIACRRCSQSSWKASSFSRGRTGPNPCVPPMSCTPFIRPGHDRIGRVPTSNVPPAEGTRRWDGDERGHGVANALSASHAVARLLEAMALPDWVAEQPEVHLLPHIEAGLTDLPLRLL